MAFVQNIVLGYAEFHSRLKLTGECVELFSGFMGGAAIVWWCVTACMHDWENGGKGNNRSEETDEKNTFAGCLRSAKT